MQVICKYHTILYKGLLVSVGGLGINPLWILQISYISVIRRCFFFYKMRQIRKELEKNKAQSLIWLEKLISECSSC